ncbi:13900_t:CDS:2 [Racocetra persica]|uniref:13900_t:CDS:1 n=1 Tax=Racocetra persica TaxID=160502 RepID=A0ACA9QA08_9GLOM|nr:13900_t:CDS:2 [Racocetra persica]
MPQDTVVVSRKSIFDQFDYDKTDETNKRNIEKMLFERLQEVLSIEGKKSVIHAYANTMPSKSLDVNYRNDDDNQYMQENQQDVLFRLFARDPPTKVSLEPSAMSKITVNKLESLKRRSKAERLEQIIDTMVTSSEVIMQSKTPWERNFVPHKVLHVPFENPKRSPAQQKRIEHMELVLAGQKVAKVMLMDGTKL